MSKYPIWINLDYDELGRRVKYTGSVISRVDLIGVIVRLDVQLADIHSFTINDASQPREVQERLFEEVAKTREDDEQVKQGKKPTNKQRDIIKNAGLKPENWLVVKNLQHELHIVNRSSNKQRIIFV